MRWWLLVVTGGEGWLLVVKGVSEAAKEYSFAVLEAQAVAVTDVFSQLGKILTFLQRVPA